MGLMNLEENLRIDDEKIKKLIIEVFNEKFKYMGKSNYLRWINTNSINERIKNLIVDLMSEEDIEKYPDWGGYYSAQENRIRLKNVDNHTVDHETNHFISDPIEFDKKNERFSRYINEGITEYLTKNITNDSFTAYSQNVYFVKLLHSIFGDELIKCYLTGVTSNFYNRLERLIKVNEEDNINDFESVLANLMKYLHNQDYIEYYSNINELTEEETNIRFKKYIENILINSIKEEMINFDYYDENGNIDIDLLIEVINTRFNIIRDLNRFSNEEISNDISKKMIEMALDYSYMGKYYSKEEIKKIMDNCMPNSVLSKSKLGEKVDPIEDKLFYALEMRLENKDYSKDNSVDLSELLYDVFKLLGTEKFMNKRDLFEKLIKTYLFGKFEGNVNVEFVNNILSKNFSYFYHISKIGLDNEKQFSTSRVGSFGMYNDLEIFIEKRDNVFFVIEYNDKTKESYTHRVFTVGKSYNKEYPYESNIIYLKTSHLNLHLLFDNEYNNVKCNGQKIEFKEGFKSIFDKAIIKELEIVDYEDYIHYFSDGVNNEIKGAIYLGTNFDSLNTNSRFIDFEGLLKPIKDKITICNDGTKKEIIRNNIKNVLRKTYGQMPISDELIDSITDRAYSFAMDNKIKGFDEYNIKLIKDWREYINSVEEPLVELSTKESEEKLKNKIKTENNIKNIKKYNNEYAQKEANYIEEKNSEYFDELDLSYGIIDIDYVVGKNKYSYPSAKRINYRLFVDDVKEGLLNVPEEYRTNYINIYNEKLMDNLGFCIFLPFGNDVEYYKKEIKKQIKESIETGEEPDIEELNTLTDKIITLFSNNREQMITTIKNSKVWYGKYTSDMTKHIYGKIEEISKNETMSKEEKEIKTQVLVDVANEDIQKRKDDEDYVISLQMEKILENDKRWKKVY